MVDFIISTWQSASCILDGLKESTCNAGDPGSIPGLGRSPGEGKDYLLQYSGLENSMDSTVHGCAKAFELTRPHFREGASSLALGERVLFTVDFVFSSS